MAARRQRQTIEKYRREQLVRQRRADKLQKKEEARLARAAGALPGEASVGPDAATELPAATGERPEGVDTATVLRN